MNRKHLYGLTLVEMMVAVTLSLILMAGVFKIVSSSKQTYALQSELATLQENARFVMDDISYNIRMAGYYGFSVASPVDVPPGINLGAFQCAGNNPSNCDNNFPESDSLTLTAFGQDGKLVLRQYDPAIPAGQPNGIAIPDQFIEVSDSNVKNIVDGAKATNAAQLNIGSGKSFYLRTGAALPQKIVDGQPNWLIISNFGRAGFYSIEALDVANAQITLGSPFGVSDEPFAWPVEVFDSSKIRTTHYEIVKINNTANSTVFNCRENSVPCHVLFKCATDPCTANEKNRNNPAYSLLMEGVENMQIRYGIDPDVNDMVNTFANNPLGNSKVISVRVVLLMRTISRRADVKDATDRIFDLDTGLSYAPDDPDAPKFSLANVYSPSEENEAEERGFRHRLFTSTVRVRN
ncbi:MAG: hypothetical protein BWK79_06920 [Beggiatoa sp. IS2]|nr:MAG: hypothetical protein BWK79_06920 [Beggiatoa sp. IS2]